uniref:Uncharacterized protein n=1 Tax=Cacopsylla melanoneura TaxID=428564 RepID=A0A8D9AHX2_9HEMI
MKSSRARVLNVDHVRLGESKHCLSVSKDDGTIDLLAFEHRDVRTNETMDTSFSNISNVNASEDKHVKANDTVMDSSNISNEEITLDTDVNNASLEPTIALNKQDIRNSIANGTEKESIANEIENASLVNKGIKRTSSCKENDVVVENTELAPLEEETIKVNSNNMSELNVNNMNGTTLEDDVNNEHIEKQRLGDEKVAQKRKRHTSDNVEEVRNKKMKLSDEDDGENELNGAENELESNMSNEVGKTDDISSTNENGSKENGTNASKVENEPKKNKSEIGKADTIDNRDLSKTKTILKERENRTRNAGNLEPAKYVVYDKTDNVVVSNLMVSYIDDNVLIVFSKLSFICYVLLDKEGQVLESNQIKIRTRFITAMVKFVKNKYFVVTFENKVLVVSIGRLGGRDGRRTEIGLDSNENGMTTEKALDPNENSMTRDSICVRNETLNESIQSGHEESIGNTNANTETGENKLDTTSKGESTRNVINKVISTDSSSSCKHITIVVRKIIDLSNPTHTINGIANSTNNFLTVLSFRIKVKFETYFKSSRNPSQLALTSFQSASRFLSSQLPNQSSPVYKQIDMMKFITLNNVNFFRLNSICMSLQNVQLKYFIVKLFKPKQQSEGKKSHFTQVLEQLENTIFLNHIKKCVRDGIFREDRQVLFLFREWTKRTFPADKHDLKKLTSCFPTEEYNELCVICSSKIAGVESLHYAVCSAKHRVLRCSLSLLQCLGSFVQCQYCSVFASKKYAENARCVFCDASFPVN